MTHRFYVTKTWDDWPEGGSCGTIVRAKNVEAAEKAAVDQMAASRAEEGTASKRYYLKNYSPDWHAVDCFDLDAFIARHKDKDAGR